MKKGKLVAVSLIIKLLVLGLTMVVDKCFEDYDTSMELLVAPKKQDSSIQEHIPPENPLLVTARFDSSFFIEIAQNQYRYEKNHAFFPMYPTVLKFISNTLSAFNRKLALIDSLLISSLLLNLALNSLNTLLLYYLTQLLFPNRGQNFSTTVALIFQFTPSSAFFTAVYSEQLFLSFVLTFLYLFHAGLFKAISKNHPIKKNLANNKSLSAADQDTYGVYPESFTELFTSPGKYSFSLVPTLVLSTSVFVRSNGMFWVVIVGYPILHAFISNVFGPRRQFSFAVLFNTMFWGVLNIVAVVVPYVLTLLGAANIYCKKDYFDAATDPSWCHPNFGVPNVYSFIQDKHWDVGFFTYYRLSKIFFIVWGICTFILLGESIRRLICTIIRQKISPIQQSKGDQLPASIYDSPAIYPHAIYTTILLVISVCYANVQSSTRFFATDPCLYWFIADFLFKTKDNRKHDGILQSLLVLGYLCVFNIGGLFLFTNYSIWT